MDNSHSNSNINVNNKNNKIFKKDYKEKIATYNTAINVGHNIHQNYGSNQWDTYIMLYSFSNDPSIWKNVMYFYHNHFNKILVNQKIGHNIQIDLLMTRPLNLKLLKQFDSNSYI